MDKFTDFYEAYHFLNNHYYFEHGVWKEPCLTESLDVMVVKIDPEINEVNDIAEKNTKTQVWLECGPWEDVDEWSGYSHDIELDTGGDTFEEAIINLANLVYEQHGENPEGYGELTEEEMADINKRFGFILDSSDN